MKHIAITLTALLVAASAYAQGTLNFANRVTGVLDARVSIQGGGGPVDNNWYGQLLAGASEATLAPIGSPVEFRGSPDAAKGYIVSGGVVAVPGVAGGSPATVRMVAWNKSVGATWEAAQAANLGGIGQSAPITVNTGGGGTPPSPAANLVGLAAFEVTPVIPEPAIAALGLLGAGLLLLRRKK
jgi:hypothetical protein